MPVRWTRGFSGGINVTPIGTARTSRTPWPCRPMAPCWSQARARSPAARTAVSFAPGRDGGLDATFGTGGKVTTPVATGNNSDEAYAVAVQPDGKILVAGNANMGVAAPAASTSRSSTTTPTARSRPRSATAAR